MNSFYSFLKELAAAKAMDWLLEAGDKFHSKLNLAKIVGLQRRNVVYTK